MLKTGLALVLLALVCSLAAPAQRVKEDASSLVLNNGVAQLKLRIASPQSTSVDAMLRILDAANKTRAEKTQAIRLTRGEHTYEVRIPIGELVSTAGDDLPWMRLEYRVGDAAGLISLSQLMTDDFDLRAATSPGVVPGQTFSVRVRAINPVSESPVKGVAIKSNSRSRSRDMKKI